MSNDHLNAADGVSAGLIRAGSMADALRLAGVFTLQHLRDGEVIYEEDFHNTVVTVGKNEVLNQALAGSSYTAANYMGLIEDAGYSAIAAGDTMASHAGWTEATSYSGSRKTCAWAAASAGAKALSSALSFAITGTDTIKGCFIGRARAPRRPSATPAVCCSRLGCSPAATAP